MGIGNTSCTTLIHDNELLELKEIERSIIKTYRKDIWSKFVKAIQTYNLIEEGDKVAVAISGGKDSLLLAKLFQELQKHKVKNFELEFISMDPGFNEVNLKMLKENCEHLNIPVKIKESHIFDIVGEISQEYPCYMCARMRRGFLYEFAKELGCNKMALGHHFDDVIETTMLNVLYGGMFKTMLPRIKASNFEDIELIRPMYFIKENDIKRYSINAGLRPMNCGCVVAAGKTSSKRSEIKEMIKNLKEVHPNVDISIFKAAENVNIESILGWYEGDNGKKHSFLEMFESDDNE